MALRVDGRHHHLVHRQGAGLVGVDRARGAEGLDVGQVLHHGLGVGEPASTLRQQRRHERRHAGGDRGDRHRHPEQQHLVQLEPAEQAHDDDDGDRGPGHDADDPRELVQFLLQWRPRPLDRGEHAGDLAHLRLHAGGRDDEGARATGDRGVLEEHVRPVTEGHVVSIEGRGVLAHRCALAGQRGLLRLQRRRADEAAVSGHDVAGLDLHDVAGDDVLRRDERELPVPDHPALRHLELGQRVHAGSGGELLPGAEGQVQHDEQRHDGGRRDLADDEADDGHGHEHQVHRVPQLPQGDGDHGRRLLARDVVRPVGGQSGRGLGRR